jgi:hypothetical protein
VACRNGSGCRNAGFTSIEHQDHWLEMIFQMLLLPDGERRSHKSDDTRIPRLMDFHAVEEAFDDNELGVIIG